jgi:hypothetical protein
MFILSYTISIFKMMHSQLRGPPDETLNNGKGTPKAPQHLQDAERRNTPGTQPGYSNDTARSAHQKLSHRPNLP